MVSSEPTGELSEEDEDLRNLIQSTIAKTVTAHGIVGEDAIKLAGSIYDSLDTKSLVGNKHEYGVEDINSGNIVKCNEDQAEFYKTVSEWAPYQF